VPSPARVEICDVAPRDGLQNEARSLSPETRAELCDRLAAAGLRRIEAVSFVNPARVPQMAGAEEVMAALDRSSGASYAGLVLNVRGYERALAAGVDELHYAFPITDTYAQRNQGTTVEGAIDTAAEITRRAHADGLRVSVTLAASFGCPFEGRVAPADVLRVAERVQAAGPGELVLADTIGVGVPSQATELVRGALALGATVGCHLHNTRNTGFANAFAALEAGATLLDAAVGGSGGCPFAPGAAGNIATEDLVYMLDGMGVATGIDFDALLTITPWLAQQLGRELPSMTAKAPPFPPPAAAS
jgi:hydroxymethylglutaryl-CoA lyase/(R)-citramalyl-CoA lyase